MGEILAGTPQNNILYGLGGNDTLEGGAGDDALVGGLGADTFIYDLDPLIDNGNDIISGYSSLEGDIIVLQNAGGITISDLDDVLDFTINAGGKYEASLLHNNLTTSAGTIVFDNLAIAAGTTINFSLNPDFTVVLQHQ